MESLSTEQQKLVTKNAGLVYFVAKKYFAKCDSNPDLIQAGYLGLIESVLKFNPGKASLSTYAPWQIRRRMQDYLRSLSVGKRVTPIEMVSLTDFNEHYVQIPYEASNPEEVTIARNDLNKISDILNSQASKLENQELTKVINGESGNKNALTRVRNRIKAALGPNYSKPESKKNNVYRRSDSVDSERDQKLCELAKTLTMAQLCNEFNLSYTRISRILKFYKVKIQKVRLTNDQLKVISQKLSKGESIGELSKQFGVEYRTLARIFNPSYRR